MTSSTDRQPHERAVAASLGSAIRARRQALGLRQDELADLAGVSERFVYALETGKPSAQLDKVLAVLSTLGRHLELRRGSADEITVPDGGT